MEKKKVVLRLVIATSFMFIVFCIIPSVQARGPPFVQELPTYDNLAAPWYTGDFSMEFNSNDDLYFRIGAARSIEEKENDWWPKPPWRYRLYINGEEINLQRYTRAGDKEAHDPPVIFLWYHIFGPDYFVPGGEYLLKFEFWVKHSYQGDGLTYWRIFEDYWGIYGGGVWSFEYYLNII